MKIWKFLPVIALMGILLVISSCGKQEEQAVPEPEPEPAAVEVMVADYVPTGEDIGTEVVCSVCGMTMEVTAETPAVVFEDEVYYFCSADEKAEFAVDPQKYLAQPEEAVEEAIEEESGH